MKDKMTKSSVDRKRSKYGEKYTLRFHKKTKTYELSCADEVPMLIAKFVETDGDLAMRLWERLENSYQENKQLKFEIEKLAYANEELLEQKRAWKECSDNYARLCGENDELKNAIVGKIQYNEDLEKFAISKGLIKEDWARFDYYD